MSSGPDPLDLLDDLLARARRAGAEAADALCVDGVALSHAQRLGRTEKLERAESRDLGLRVFVGRRQVVVSSTDFEPETLDELAARAVAMARTVPEDPHCGLPEAALLARDPPDLDLSEPDEPAPETLVARARAAEEAARAVPGVTNSEGAEASWSLRRVALAASNGFAGAYAASHHAVAVSVLAGEGLEMERDYDFTAAVHARDLRPPEEVGRSAGERAVRRLGARKVASARVPVVFDPRVSRSLLGHLAAAVNGNAVARGTSFLKDRLGEPVFPAAVTVYDDPHRPRGLRSKPFDGEGVANRRRAVIEEGRLTTWLLDVRSAPQLGLTTTGPPAPRPRRRRRPPTCTWRRAR